MLALKLHIVSVIDVGKLFVGVCALGNTFNKWVKVMTLPTVCPAQACYRSISG